MFKHPFQIILWILFLVGVVVFQSCKKTGTITPDIPVVAEGSLQLLATFPLQVTEPSGLSFGPDNQTLLTVSDNTNQVFELSLSGEILNIWDYEGNDLEGVTYNKYNRTIAITEERDRNVIILEYDSDLVLSETHVDVHIGKENSGLEGIAFNPNNRLYYVLNESSPGEIILWSPQDGIISETELGFAEDYSGIYIEEESALMWIVSDLSEHVYACDYKGNPLTKYSLGDTKFEGVVVDHTSQTLFLVNDASAKLLVYQILNN
jgi:uncharacterized protein YjiK